MPPSITYWNRLEPRPRAPSITQTLAASIRDPLWMLTRQWQFGEFQGEDAASPAYIELSARLAALAGWRPEGIERGEQLNSGAPPLEELVESEPFTPNFALRVELGQIFETLLTQAGVPELIVNFRSDYPISLVQDKSVDYLFEITANLQTDLDIGAIVPEALRQAFEDKQITLSMNTTIWVKDKGQEWMINDNESRQHFAVIKNGSIFRIYLLHDQEAVRFLRVCAGRVIDGIALYEARKASSPGIPLKPVISDPAKQDAVKKALNELEIWIQNIFGAIGQQDPPTWKPERLEYGVEALGTVEVNGSPPTWANNLLSAYPGRDGEFDWYAFDLKEEKKTVPNISPGNLEPKAMSVLPMHVRFRGMPNARWWDFETGTTDFGDIRPDKRDLAKLIIMDFMLVAGNDWFVIPFDQPVGTLCWINSLVVHDVFGGTTPVKRAEQIDAALGAPAPGQRWTMFSISRQSELADFFILPLSAATAVQTGATLEEVRFLRDEMANMVWAVEHSTENGIGRPWPGHERNLAAKSAMPPAPALTDGSGGNYPPLRYQVQTIVPANWIPFLPISIDPAAGQFALEITAMPDAFARLISPVGRILQPTNLAVKTPYRIREEEVSPTGTRVFRIVCRSRWIDGSTYLWIARRKSTGTGEGSSGLRFDIIAAREGPQVGGENAPWELPAGKVLNPDQSISSANGQYTFIYQSDGNLVLYRNSDGQPLWASHTDGSSAGICIMQPDGNLAIYSPDEQLVWSTATNGNPGSRLLIQDDGNVVIYRRDSTPVWATNTWLPVGPAAQGNDMLPREILNPGQSITSVNGRYRFIYQTDGNLVLYQEGTALWASNTDGRPVGVCIMQSDGNLVIYTHGGQPIWSSDTWQHPGSKLLVQDDGNVVIYRPDGTPVWATNTMQP